MSDFLKLLKPEVFLWGVLLARLALARDTAAWECVPLALFLLGRPLFERYVDQVVSKRTAATAKVDALEARVLDMQGRIAGLSLAQGLKPRS